MAKNKKRNIFNQVVEEPEVKNEVVESTPIVIDPEVLKTEAPEEELEATPKEVHFEFQDNYFLGTPSESSDKETVIDTLPKEECVCEEPCVCTEPCTEPCACNTPVVEAPKQEIDINSMSRNEYRAYLRNSNAPR